jgi:membrane-associated phospholipid phosphatase
VTPPGHWNVIALDLIRGSRVSAREAAQVLAAANTAQADAFIACWDAKFTYWSERPVTAIRRELDPGYSPYIATPPFPSCVSGHSTTSGAASEVLARFFPRAARELRRSAEEAAVSRLYGGIHFSSDNEAGLALGKRVAAAAIVAYDG